MKNLKNKLNFQLKKKNIKEDFNNFEYISYNTAYEKKIIFHINLMRILMTKEVFLINIYHNSWQNINLKTNQSQIFMLNLKQQKNCRLGKSNSLQLPKILNK